MIGPLARLVVKHRWAVLAIWAGIGALATPRAWGVADVLTARSSAPEASEAARVDDELRRRFARPFGNALAITLEVPSPLDSLEPGRALDTLIAGFEAADWVSRVVSWRSTEDSSFVRADRRGTVLFVVTVGDRDDSAMDHVARARVLARSSLAQAGFDTLSYRALITGEAALNADLREVSREASRDSELRLAPATAAVLVLAFGALVAAALPVLVGFFAIWVSLALVAAVAQATPMSIYVLNITTMLGLGVGIDYSLLVVNRFREELARMSPADAAVRATETAGMATVTSGLTVLVG
ncbi:MAG TPA: MMPL family transporter, partial [Gemmatimonadales bacterium]|nr:MMPL family transporter [Gemmatimonadales bacterium]